MFHSITTTEPNRVVEPVHEKAMPVMLMTHHDVAQWLGGGSLEDAVAMQKPAPDETVVMRPPEKKAA
jgi:putative SOS response-associated peptidase YedK